MTARRSSLAASARWEASSWLLCVVLAITGFWPWWAFHSKAGTIVWLTFVVIAFAAVKATRAGQRR